jgi:hypothetical protein
MAKNRVSKGVVRQNWSKMTPQHHLKNDIILSQECHFETLFWEAHLR